MQSIAMLIWLPAILSFGIAAASNVYQTQAEEALIELQTFYNNNTGLWHSYGVSWWQSGNALTTLANMVSLNSSYASTIAAFVFPNTFIKAEAFDVNHDYHVKRTSQAPFTDNYYDDDAWWAMGWIRTYDVTKNATYLKTAEGIFQEMTTGYGTNCSSNGMWWDKTHTEINTIANVLFLEVAAYLANRVPENKTYYTDWAEREWNYYRNSPMFLQDQNLCGGKLDLTTCQAVGDEVGSTYEQGTLIQGLTELAAVTGNQSYLQEANLVAQASMSNGNLTQDGVLREPGVNQEHLGSNLPQFKGVFMRGLMRLIESSPNASYTAFAERNAQSIWNNDRQSPAAFGPDWLGPYEGPANASLQSCAMDGLVTAWAASS